MITVICYGSKHTYTSKAAALRTYKEGVLACEGAEAERYEGIVQQLKAGFTTCYDFNGNYPVDGFSQKDVLNVVTSMLK